MKIIKCDKDFIQKNKSKFVDLYKELVYVHYPEKVENELIFNNSYSDHIDRISNYVFDNSGIVLSMVSKEEIIGYAHIYRRNFLNEKRMMISDFIISKEYRKKGYANLLLIEIEKEAICDCDSIETLVTVNNPIALNMYLNFGLNESRIHLVKSI